MIRTVLALLSSVVLVGTAGAAVAAPSAPARAPAAAVSQAGTAASDVTPPDIAAGSTHTVLLGSDGNPRATGGNPYGQLGDGTTADADSPVPMTGLPSGITVTAVAAGFAHSVVLGSDGIAYATGLNASGQLGDGTTTDSDALVPMTGLPDGITATAIAAGSDHSVVLGSDGIAYATGRNNEGQLGDGSTASHTSLAPVTGLPDGITAAAVAAGGQVTVVVGSDGSPFAVGKNSNGQLGDTTYANRTSLVPMSGLPAGVTATGAAAGHTHSVVLGSDGIAYATGSNEFGQLGDYGAVVQGRSSLGPMLGLPEGISATSVAAGDGHSLVLGDDGIAYATGRNDQGQIGDGTAAWRGRLTVMLGLPTGVTAHAVAAGIHHSLVRGSDGLVYGAGANGRGQLTTSAAASQRTQVLLAGQSWSNLVAPSIRGKAKVGSPARINLGTWTTPPATLSYTWIRDGSPIKGATGSTYTPRPRDLGDKIKVRITAERVALDPITVTTKAVKVAKGAVPKYTAKKKPVLKGKAKVGKLLHLKRFKAGAFSPKPKSTRIQWLRNGHVIKGATKKTYRIKKADRGKQIRVRITAKLKGHKPGKVQTKQVRIR